MKIQLHDGTNRTAVEPVVGFRAHGLMPGRILDALGKHIGARYGWDAAEAAMSRVWLGLGRRHRAAAPACPRHQPKPHSRHAGVTIPGTLRTPLPAARAA